MTTILIKKKDTAGAPAAGDLTNAAGGTEIAVNTATKRIYTKDAAGNVVELGTNASASTVADLTVTNTLTVSGTVTSSLKFTDNTYDIGASGATRPRSLFLGSNLNVAGTAGIGTAASSDVTLRVDRTSTGDAQYGILNATSYGGTGTNAYGILNQANVRASASFSSYTGFLAVQPAFGAGATVTSQSGFAVDNTLTGATNNFGFSSSIASGTGRWNFYAAGTAANYFAGNTGIGVAPTVRLEVAGNVNFANGAQITQLISSTTSAGNQPTLSFQHAGNNTFSLRGGSDLQFYSDGTTNLRATLTNAGTLLVGPSSSQSTSKIVSSGAITLQAIIGSPGDAFPSLLFYNNNSSGFTNASISATVGTTINSGNIIFNTNNSGAFGEVVRIAQTGSVGIGYTSLTDVGSNGLAVLGSVSIGTNVGPTYVGAPKLTVYGNQASPHFALIRNDSASASAASAIALNAYGNTWGIECGSAAKNGNSLTFLLDYAGANQRKMTLDGYGNLAIGNFAPYSVWGGGYNAVQVNGNGRSLAATGAGAGDLTLAFNAVYDSTDSRWEYAYTGDPASRYSTKSGVHQFFSAVAGTANAAISFYETMSVDSNGRMTVSASPGNNTGVYMSGSSANCTNYAMLMGVTGISNGGFSLRDTTNSVTTFAISPQGRATIGSNMSPAYSATLTLQSAGNSYNLTCSRIGGGTGSTGQVVFENDNGAIGSIFTSGSTTSYNTSSDYRLKNTIAPMTGALARVMQLNPVTYKWNTDGADGEGFIAHELAEVVPQAVTGEKDAVDEDGKPQYQGIDVSFLVATLTAAIQELKVEFDAYKASHP